jgi:hypothetical protein
MKRSIGMAGKASRRCTKVSIEARFVAEGEDSDIWRVVEASMVEEGNASTGNPAECASGKGGASPCASM